MIDRLVKKIFTISILFSFFVILGCSEDIKTNTVDPDQVNVDNSSNYEFIFKDRIENEKEKESLQKNF